MLGFLLLPFALLIWSQRIGTLRVPKSDHDPKGHGFLSPINLYMLVVPLLDYEIASYFRIFDEKLMDGTSQGFIPNASSQFARQLSRWDLSWWLIGIPLGSICLVLLITEWPRIKKIQCTNWHYTGGKPRAISYYFHAMLFGVQGTAFGIWLVCHILGWSLLPQFLNTDGNRFNPDKMFGLSTLSNIVWHSYGVVLCATLLVVVWLGGVRLTNPSDSILQNPGRIAAIVFFLLVGPAVVLAPLVGTHLKMARTKAATLSSLGAQINQFAINIQSQVSVIAGNAEQDSKRLNEADDLYKRAEDSSTWPLSLPLFGSFAGLISPALVALITKYGEALHKWLRATVSDILPEPFKRYLGHADRAA